MEARDRCIVVRVAERPLEIPGVYSCFKKDDRVLLLVRPESISIGKPASELIAGKISESVYLGSEVLYGVKIGEQIVTAEVADPEEGELFPIGATVGVRLRAGNLYALPYEEETG